MSVGTADALMVAFWVVPAVFVAVAALARFAARTADDAERWEPPRVRPIWFLVSLETMYYLIGGLALLGWACS